ILKVNPVYSYQVNRNQHTGC
ncbi:hypothetical protein A5885_000400, partial [Enterococcus sp. 8E11_MSG4843]